MNHDWQFHHLNKLINLNCIWQIYRWWTTFFMLQILCSLNLLISLNLIRVESPSMSLTIISTKSKMSFISLASSSLQFNMEKLDGIPATCLASSIRISKPNTRLTICSSSNMVFIFKLIFINKSSFWFITNASNNFFFKLITPFTLSVFSKSNNVKMI